MTHYIAMAGLHGYLPNYCAAHESYASAVDDLARLHELSKSQTLQLSNHGSLELNLPRDGNEYCEVTECYCPGLEAHDDN